MGKNSLRGTTTCYVINSRADKRFHPKYAQRGKQTAGTGKQAFETVEDHIPAFHNMVQNRRFQQYGAKKDGL